MKLYADMSTGLITAQVPVNLEEKRAQGLVISIGPLLAIPLNFANRQIQAMDYASGANVIIEIEFVDPQP